MLFVPVVSSTGKPLMPCHPARARELVRAGKALRRFNKGMFYIRLTQRADGKTQPIGAGIDSGSKREAVTVKSEAHTFINLQLTAVDWVKDAVEVRRNMRRGRRFRNTPCRANRSNRGVGFRLPPSTRARWGWKLRIATWLSKMFPISRFAVEDIKAHSNGGRRWNASFSPLEVGKKWFYKQLEKLAPVDTLQGYETAELRRKHRLAKSKNKLSEIFEAHCVDSWVLANWYTGGHTYPDNKRMLLVTPLRFHRRQLHRLQPEIGGTRKVYGSTRSLGFKRGSLVKHVKYGLVYVGGFLKQRLSLHCLSTGKRLGQSFKPEDCKFLAFNTWRTALLPAINGEVSEPIFG